MVRRLVAADVYCKTELDDRDFFEPDCNPRDRAGSQARDGECEAPQAEIVAIVNVDVSSGVEQAR